MFARLHADCMKTKAAGIATLLALAGIIVSELLGPGTEAPRATIFTCVAAVLFIVFQYIYLRSKFGWGVVKAIIVLALLLLPELLLEFILSFLWFVVLPLIGMIILIMIVGNRKL